MSRLLLGCITLALASLLTALGAAPAAAQSGEVVFYDFPGEHIQPTIDAFEKKSPAIKVRAITGQGPAMMARVLAEQGNPQCDVADLGADQIMAHTDAFQPYHIADASQFPNWAVIRKGNEIYGYAYALSIQLFLVNTSMMTPEETPKSWSDLIQAKYKGKFLVGNPALTSAGYDSFGQLIQLLGPDHIADYVRNAVFSAETNLVPQDVGRGEAPMGLVEETKSYAMMTAGYPVKLVYPSEGVVATIGGWALIRNAPHPENAKLSLEFVNSREGQDINVAARKRRSGRNDANPPTGLPPTSQLHFNSAIDANKMVADHDANVTLFNQIFQKQQQGG